LRFPRTAGERLHTWRVPRVPLRYAGKKRGPAAPVGDALLWRPRGILAIARGRNAAQTSRSVSKQNAPTSVARALRFAMRQTSIINLSMTFLKCSLKRVSAQMRCGALPTVRVGPLGRLRGPLGPRPAFCNDLDSAADDKGTGTDLRCADTHGQQNSEACGVPGRPSGYPCSTGRELRTRPKGAFSGAAMAAIAGPRHEAVIDAEPAGRSHRKRN